jgi:hypothetical protein
LKINIQNNHCCKQGGPGKNAGTHFSCKIRQWDIENKAHHRLKESKMGRKGLEEDFKAQNEPEAASLKINIQNNHCCKQGGQGKMQALISLQNKTVGH